MPLTRCDIKLLALAAQSAYRVKQDDKIDPNEKPEYGEMLADFEQQGYRVSHGVAPQSSGGSGKSPLAATCLTPVGGDGPIVIAFRGTKTTGDMVSDALIGVTGVVEKKFRDEAFQFYLKMKDKYPNQEIVLTGHSLGGSLAQYVATKAYNTDPELQQKPTLHVRTFNTAPVYTTHEKVFRKEPTGPLILNNFKHYRLEKDLVSNLGLQKTYGDIYSFKFDKFAAHSMSDMVKGLPQPVLKQEVGTTQQNSATYNSVLEQVRGIFNSYECRVRGQWFSKHRAGSKNLAELNSIRDNLINHLEKKEFGKALELVESLNGKLSGKISNNILSVMKLNIGELKRLDDSPQRKFHRFKQQKLRNEELQRLSDSPHRKFYGFKEQLLGMPSINKIKSDLITIQNKLSAAQLKYGPESPTSAALEKICTRVEEAGEQYIQKLNQKGTSPQQRHQYRDQFIESVLLTIESVKSTIIESGDEEAISAIRNVAQYLSSEEVILKSDRSERFENCPATCKIKELDISLRQLLEQDYEQVQKPQSQSQM